MEESEISQISQKMEFVHSTHLNCKAHCHKRLLIKKKSTENNEVQRLPHGSGSPRAVSFWSLGVCGEELLLYAFPAT